MAETYTHRAILISPSARRGRADDPLYAQCDKQVAYWRGSFGILASCLQWLWRYHQKTVTIEVTDIDEVVQPPSLFTNIQSANPYLAEAITYSSNHEVANFARQDADKFTLVKADSSTDIITDFNRSEGDKILYDHVTSSAANLAAIGLRKELNSDNNMQLVDAGNNRIYMIFDGLN